MSSSSSSHLAGPATPIASSSRSDDEDELLTSEDPLSGDGALDSISFKRIAKPQKPSLASRFLPSPFRPPSTPASDTNTSPRRRNQAANNSSYDADHAPKDPRSLDWHVEGPGRRVGYDNLTAIDWIYEYSKERTRLRQLHASSTGIIGQLRLLIDASQVWWVLVATGVAVGSIAAGIDVASDWLGDLKTGVCRDVDGEGGGGFYLNKVFCCWGTESYAQCPGWNTWGGLMGVGNKGGGYIVGYIIFVLFSVLFAAAASTLVVRFSVYAKQSGIPEIKTMLGGVVIKRFLGGWTLLVKSLGLCLAVASGMWLGKEGPLVHVACCCANLFMKLFPGINDNEARKREVLSAAAASGISVAFGAPIGGVLFSLEQLSYYFPDKTMWASFVCAMVAAVTLQAYDPFRTGQLVLYQVTYHSGWHAFEIFPFAVLGIMGGLYGAMFIKLNMRVASWRNSSSNPFRSSPIREVILVALITALISFPITFLRAQSSELVEYLFAECRDITDDFLGLCKSGVANTGVILILLVSAVLGFLLATVTFGLQIPAGILLPSMAVGALYGRVVGLIVEVWQREHPNFSAFTSCEPDVPCVTPGTYAVVGAASALAGATRMTVSIIVIMFELTGALTYVLPIMIAVMLSKWVGDAFGKAGIYESWIHFQKYPFLDNKDDSPVPDIPVSEVMTRAEDLVCITATDHTIDSLRDLLREHPYRGFPVVTTAEVTLLGYISRTELTFALDSSSRSLPGSTQCYFQHEAFADPTTTLDLRPWMDQTPITLNSRSSLMLTNEMFQKLGLRFVVFADQGRLAGLVTKKDLWSVLNEYAGSGRRIIRDEILDPSRDRSRSRGLSAYE
ncbi:voltage-gated chloride channel protein [Zymoseptoria brevis]|uniref:Chloride channel protein n=1 Tax=Zymoseptoria brevis TaxID=1047168 RepID=A0A0F4GYU6_9PEZI|nr:voltage-gated chloride channel protein [Zymoseptoria brevis]